MQDFHVISFFILNIFSLIFTFICAMEIEMTRLSVTFLTHVKYFISYPIANFIRSPICPCVCLSRS